MRGLVLTIAALTPSARAGVQVLDATNWEASVAAQPDTLWLVKFYAPWCGHCKRLAPILDEVADEAPDVKVGKVDCTVETGLRERFHVKGYPTLILMQGGKTWEHRGQRTKAGLLALLDRMRRPAVLPLAAQSDLDAARGSVLFVFGRGGGAGAGAQAHFDAVARSRQHADDFAATEADDVLRSLGLGDAVASPPFWNTGPPTGLHPFADANASAHAPAFMQPDLRPHATCRRGPLWQSSSRARRSQTCSTRRPCSRWTRPRWQAGWPTTGFPPSRCSIARTSGSCRRIPAGRSRSSCWTRATARRAMQRSGPRLQRA